MLISWNEQMKTKQNEFFFILNICNLLWSFNLLLWSWKGKIVYYYLIRICSKSGLWLLSCTKVRYVRNQVSGNVLWKTSINWKKYSFTFPELCRSKCIVLKNNLRLRTHKWLFIGPESIFSFYLQNQFIQNWCRSQGASKCSVPDKVWCLPPSCIASFKFGY